MCLLSVHVWEEGGGGRGQQYPPWHNHHKRVQNSSHVSASMNSHMRCSCFCREGCNILAMVVAAVQVVTVPLFEKKKWYCLQLCVVVLSNFVVVGFYSSLSASFCWVYITKPDLIWHVFSDAEPKYLVAVQPIPANDVKKHCTGMLAATCGLQTDKQANT